MTEDLRFRTPHKAGQFHWYEEEWGISIYLTNDAKYNCGIRWNVLKRAMQRAAKLSANKRIKQGPKRAHAKRTS